MDQIIQRSPIGVAVIEHDGVFRTVNPSFCHIHGYRQEELLGRCFTLLLAQPEHNRVMALHRDFLDRSADMDDERVVLRRDGSMLNVIAHSVRVPGDEGQWRRLVYVVDITERHRMESALQASQRFTRSMLDGSRRPCLRYRRQREKMAFSRGLGGSMKHWILEVPNIFPETEDHRCDS